MTSGSPLHPVGFRAKLAWLAIGGAASGVLGGCAKADCSELANCTVEDDASLRDAGDAGDAGDATDVSDRDAASDGAPQRDCDAAEDCTNGVDDNCDGLVDCADPTCTAQNFACVPLWPTAGGWFAPAALFDGISNAGLPDCAGRYGHPWALLYNSPDAGTTTCACGCGPVQDAGCSDPVVGVWTERDCKSTPLSIGTGTQCVHVSTQGGINSAMILDAGVIVGGACDLIRDAAVPPWNPSGVAPESWGHVARICVPSSHDYHPGTHGGCDAATTCAEVVPSTFGSTPCVVSSGMVACPSGYPAAHLYFDGGTDTRNCDFGACSCTSPAGSHCAPTVNLHGGGCPATGTAYAVDTSCSNWGTANANIGQTQMSVSATVVPAVANGACALGGSAIVTGSIDSTSGATTVCCAQ